MPSLATHYWKSLLFVTFCDCSICLRMWHTPLVFNNYGQIIYMLYMYQILHISILKSTYLFRIVPIYIDNFLTIVLTYAYDLPMWMHWITLRLLKEHWLLEDIPSARIIQGYQLMHSLHQWLKQFFRYILTLTIFELLKL